MKAMSFLIPPPMVAAAIRAWDFGGHLKVDPIPRARALEVLFRVHVFELRHARRSLSPITVAVLLGLAWGAAGLFWQQWLNDTAKRIGLIGYTTPAFSGSPWWGEIDVEKERMW